MIKPGRSGRVTYFKKCLLELQNSLVYYLFYTLQSSNFISSEKRPRERSCSVRTEMLAHPQVGSPVGVESCILASKCIKTNNLDNNSWNPTVSPLLVSKNDFVCNDSKCNPYEHAVSSISSEPSQSNLATVSSSTNNLGFGVSNSVAVPSFVRYCYPVYSEPNFGQQPSIVPPPPSVPIINPIVYDNNIDVGMSDLHYISSDAFTMLNAHPRPVICIPRFSQPCEQREPTELIPSLLPPQKSKQYERAGWKHMDLLAVDSLNSDSPSLLCSDNQRDDNNRDKVIVLGFSWEEVHLPLVAQDDLWVRK